MNDQALDIGLIGLAVMGEKLALDIESRGLSVCVCNRTAARVGEFPRRPARDRRVGGATTSQGYGV